MTPLSLTDYGLLLATSLLAGAINAVAGGGSFFTFPVLLLTGIPPIAANATNKLGLWMGAVGSLKAYLPEIRHDTRALPRLLALNLAGGITGALLLLVLSNEQFRASVPWLLLLAFLMFAFGPALRKRLGLHAQHDTVQHTLASMLGQFVMAVYCGFFGAGIGIFLLALYQWMGMHNLQRMNALKVVATTAAHSISALVLVLAGQVVWSAAMIMLVGAFIGGYASAALSRHVPQVWLRRFVLAYSATITAYFFVI